MAEVIVTDGDDAESAEEVAEAVGDAAREVAEAVGEAVSDAVGEITDAIVDVVEAVSAQEEAPREEAPGWQSGQEALGARVEALEDRLSGGLSMIEQRLATLADDLQRGTEMPPDVDATIVEPDVTEEEIEEDARMDLPFWHPGRWL